MDKQKSKKQFKNYTLLIRLGLTAVLAVVFVFVFIFAGGLNYVYGLSGKIKCFANNEFEVHYIDVGQGDSAFIRFPDKTTMLIDAGPTSSGDDVCEYLTDLFKQEKIDCIDYFVLTHQDADHVGGASDVFENFQINCLYRPKVYSNYEIQTFGNPEGYEVSTTNVYNSAIVSGYNEPNCKIRYSCAGINWGNEKYTVKFLSPNKDNYKNDNNAYSPIIKITYLSRSFLFTGDAESKIENEVIERFPEELKADVLKVAHHGASNGSGETFLSYVKPSVAVISVGKKNSYGHPNSSTLDRLNNINCKVYMTSTYGSIAMSVDSAGNIVLGGKSATVTDFALIVSIFFIAIVIVWGVKPKSKKRKKSKKYKQQEEKAKNK